MPYARRSPDGEVTALLREPEGQAPEWLPPDHPDVRHFLGAEQKLSTRKGLRSHLHGTLDLLGGDDAI